MAGTAGQPDVRADPRQPLEQAFEALDHYPALEESRDRLLQALASESSTLAAEIARSDIGLSIALLRAARRPPRLGPHRVTSIAEALATLDREQTEEVLRGLPLFGFFPGRDAFRSGPLHFALHASAAQRAASQIAERIGHSRREEVLTGALLHDVGKLALTRAFPGYDELSGRDGLTPEQRVARERRELGVDHARVGADLARRWGLPQRLVEAIAGHHDENAEADAALLRLSDLLAHYQRGERVDAIQAHKTALALGLGREALGDLMYDLTYPIESAAADEGPCPLTGRELDVLRELAAGKVYKQVASALGISTSTVRNHAHNAYRKLGVVDRAQAVVLASERGWL